MNENDIRMADKYMADMAELYLKNIRSNLDDFYTLSQKGDRLSAGKAAARIAQVAASMKDQYLLIARALCPSKADMAIVQEDLVRCVTGLNAQLKEIQPDDAVINGALERSLMPAPDRTKN